VVIKTMYSAGARDDLDVPYRCDACGFVGRARVAVLGHAEVRGSNFGYDALAAETAREQAAETASEGGRLAIALKPCPRCAEVAPEASEEWRQTYLIPGYRTAIILFVFLAGIIGVAGLGQRGWAPYIALFGVVLGAVLGFVVAKVGFWAKGRAVQEISSTVVITETDPSARF
jgi:hypothetical protein